MRREIPAESRVWGARGRWSQRPVVWPDLKGKAHTAATARSCLLEQSCRRRSLVPDAAGYGDVKARSSNQNVPLPELRTPISTQAAPAGATYAVLSEDQLPLPVKIRSVLVPTGFQLES